MAQFGRPDGDITVGSFSPYPSTPTTLFDKIDEETQNGDTDYIVSSTDEDMCEVSLTDVDDPESNTGHIIRCYAKAPGGAGAKEKMTISLVENGTVRASSDSTNVERTAYGLIEYTLTTTEADSIGNYANLRLRFDMDVIGSGEEIRITQAEFECPDATFHVYAGDIPVNVIPDEPEGILTMTYAGDIPAALLPSSTRAVTAVYAGDIPAVLLPSSTRIVEMLYAGDVPVVVLPDEPEGIVGMVYAGDLPLTVTPASTYGLFMIYIYAGDIPAALTPSYTSIVEAVYAGDIPMTLAPSSTRILEMVYAGDVPVVVLPDFPQAPLEKDYAGDIPVVILPDFPEAALEKSYAGSLPVVVVPASSYLLETPGAQVYEYSGNIPLVTLPSHALIVDAAYGGIIQLVPLPTSLYSGIRAAQDSYPTGRPYGVKKELVLIGEKEPVLIGGKKKPTFAAEEDE